MTRSSIRNLSLSSAWLAASCAGAVESDLRLKYESRLGYHINRPRDLASHRHAAEIEERLKLTDNLQLVGGVRAWAEAAFATNESRYGATEVRRRDSAEARVRDLFVQYKHDWLVLRLGNQQVAWGEAFGFYYADIVNPKDFRELGIGDLEAQRLPTPMINAKAVFGESSLQLLYIPKPFFHVLPAQGSDFAPPYSRYFPGATVRATDDTNAKLTLDNGEIGVRGTYLLSPVDLSLFYLSYLDRMPSYRVTVAPPVVDLRGVHERIHTVGGTLTTDLGAILVRVESLYTKDRPYDAIRGNAYVNARSDDFTGVLGLDYTQLEQWRVGLQLSYSHAFELIPGALTQRDREMVSVHANGDVFGDHTLDAILSYAFQDGSSLAQLRYTVPLTGQFEVQLAADLLEGGAASQFGQYRRASRLYALLRAYFGK